MIYLTLLTLVSALGGWQPVESPTVASLRAVAVSADGLICVAGSIAAGNPDLASQAVVFVSDDAAKTWVDRTPIGVIAADYRCAVIPDDNSIVIASAGSPAIILRSENRGVDWTVVHRDTRPSAFLDSIRFWDDQHGIAFGDPIDGKFILLATADAGRSWQELACDIEPLHGEAGFAASNGSIALFAQSSVVIGLGGRSDGGPGRVLRSNDCGKTWDVSAVGPMLAGPSSGIFAIAMKDDGFGVAVGGDYQQPNRAAEHIAISEDGGKTWRAPTGSPPRAYRSSVVYVPAGYWLATGPAGTDISDDGETWRPLADSGDDASGYHAIGWGNVIIATGSEGRIAILAGE
jgi:photosystem II stability/assembly factor-like uncharacterized protein